jgi:hypothetical protein
MKYRYDELLRSLPHSNKKIIGITGPPAQAKAQSPMD